MLKDKVNQLFKEQLSEWDLAKKNYHALEHVKTKSFILDNKEYKVQFNPARIISSASKVDVQSIRERKCFLCSENLPAEQKVISFKDRYFILVNPYPIFPRHLTIPLMEHTPQLIYPRFGDMLDIAQQLDDYVVFYNGPKCGASAPDHFHFQAGNKGFLPIENDMNRRNAISFESDNKEELLESFQQIYDNLPLQPGDSEPMMNILTWYDTTKWGVCIFARKKHRPSCYGVEDENSLLISPGAVDLGGMFITPLEKDFEKITVDNVIHILNEVVLHRELLEKM